MSGRGWTTVADLVALLQRRWKRGTYLRPHVTFEEFVPISIPIRSPSAAEMVAGLDESLQWLRQFEADNRSGTPHQRFALEHKVRRSRTLGDNEMPVRARIDSFEQLCALLGTAGEVKALDTVAGFTHVLEPRLLAWVAAHPVDALRNADIWQECLATVRWMLANDLSQTDLRHVDVPGVDSKFVERNRKILRQLLDELMPPESINPTATRFTDRYGFRAKPTYVRFRVLSPVRQIPLVLTELEVRTDELAHLELDVSTVFIVENRASYLAFPPVPGSIVVFGGGYAVTVLDAVGWLADRELVYWGDIDTHGLAILSRLRERFADVRSILMDRETLISHSEFVGVEESQHGGRLVGLTAAEASLYDDLITDRLGPSLRLEQERVRFSAVKAAVRPWVGRSA